MICQHCGLTYNALKTGLTYQDVYAMLWTGSDDPEQWRYKGRSGVLGLWHEIKRDMWKEHKRRCAYAAHYTGNSAQNNEEATDVDQVYPF